MPGYNIKYCLHCMSQIDTSGGEFCPNCGQKHSVHYAQSYELPAGTYLKNNRYLVGKSIGSGGFGITYIGFDFSLQRMVLIKETFYNGMFRRNCYDRSNSNLLMVSYGSDFSLDEIMRKTNKECMALSEGRELNNIVKVFDWFSENNTAYIITEFINGVTLEERVKQKGCYSWQELYKQIKPLMTSLSILHNRGIIHRDIKPLNIMIRNDTEEFVLIDFGLARSLETKTLTSVGCGFTPGYSPYEQRAFLKRDNTYTDIYALAATIYYALVGESPTLDMQDTIDGNFPQIDLMRTEFGVPDYVVSALRFALNPNYNLRCSSVNELIKMFTDVEKKQPHYLRAAQRNSEYEDLMRNRTDDDIRKIREEYRQKKQLQEQQNESRRREIDETLSILGKFYRKTKPKYEPDPTDLKNYIVPAILVVGIIIFLMITK